MYYSETNTNIKANSPYKSVLLTKLLKFQSKTKYRQTFVFISYQTVFVANTYASSLIKFLSARM